MVNFGPLAAEIVSLVWGTSAPQQISTGFASWQRYCIAKLRRWTEGSTCIRQGGHHVGHWSTFLVSLFFCTRSTFCCKRKFLFSVDNVSMSLPIANCINPYWGWTKFWSLFNVCTFLILITWSLQPIYRTIKSSKRVKLRTAGPV